VSLAFLPHFFLLPIRADFYKHAYFILKFKFFKLFHEQICLNVETGGSDGLLAQKPLEITDEVLSSYKNQGGYDMLGRTKDQIRTIEQVNGAMASCQALKLDALVIIGGMLHFINQLRFQYTALFSTSIFNFEGVTSNTDAAQLAETFAKAKCPTKVDGRIFVDPFCSVACDESYILIFL
jgi:hypothetical protein